MSAAREGEAYHCAAVEVVGLPGHQMVGDEVEGDRRDDVRTRSSPIEGR